MKSIMHQGEHEHVLQSFDARVLTFCVIDHVYG